MPQVRVKVDCEHGAKGTLLEVDASKLEAFLTEGKVTLVDPDDVPLKAQDELREAMDKYDFTPEDAQPGSVGAAVVPDEKPKPRKRSKGASRR